MMSPRPDGAACVHRAGVQVTDRSRVSAVGRQAPCRSLRTVETLIWETDPPELRAPILVCSFRGWNDAAGAASTALATVAASLDAELVASVDPEEYFDFQANRPMIS